MSYLKIKIDDMFSKPISKKLEQASPKVKHTMAIQIAKDTDPFVPALTKSLSIRTRVSENKIIYPGPYARYLYYGKVMVDSATGKGPIRIVSKDGSEVIRFRKGARLIPTEKPLKYTKSVHPQATDHWLESSKDQNLKKWIRIAGKAIENDLKK